MRGSRHDRLVKQRFYLLELLLIARCRSHPRHKATKIRGGWRFEAGTLSEFALLVGVQKAAILDQARRRGWTVTLSKRGYNIKCGPLFSSRSSSQAAPPEATTE